MGPGPTTTYRTVRPLAAGGMAEVFLAHPEGEPGRLVALKRILPHLARDTVFVDMFLREARLAATLRHPNLVGVLDAGFADGHYFLAMEYVDGADLSDLLDSAAAVDDLPLPVALTIVRDACAGLHFLHNQVDVTGRPLGLVHRDVSPSNVLVSTQGVARVTDYGIATATAHTRTTEPGTVKGKAAYMAPEQCMSGALDRRADVFSLGILLYETITKSRLFVGDNEFAVMMQVTTCDFDAPRRVDPNIPEALEAIILKALQREPDARYPSAGHLQIAIEGFAARRGIALAPGPVAAWVARHVAPQPVTMLGAASPSSPRRPWVWAVAATLVAGLGIGLAVAASDADAETTSAVPAVPATATATTQPPSSPAPAPAQMVATSPDPTTAAAPDVPNVPTPSPPSATPVAVDEALADEPTELIVIDVDEDGARKRRRPKARPKTTTPSPRYDLDEVAPPT